MGEERGDQEKWIFPQIVLTVEERKGILAEVMRIVAEIMFETHIYTFNGRVYKQRKGEPIGLRGTCALARLAMCAWDRAWKEKMMMSKIDIKGYMRYMDDGRAFLHPLKPGWRWAEGALKYSIKR